jgi:protein phosphatase
MIASSVARSRSLIKISRVSRCSNAWSSDIEAPERYHREDRSARRSGVARDLWAILGSVTGERDSLRLAHAGATHIGQVRQHNEDVILLRPDLRLFVLADGAGGHNAGNVASMLAATTIASHFEGTERGMADRPEIDALGLSTGARRAVAAVKEANREILEIAKSSTRHTGMGSTVVVLSFSPRAPVLHVAHLGDSRCYRLRGGFLEQITEDHTFRQDVLELRPELPDEAIRKLPLHVVTRGLGLDPAIRVSVKTLELAAGDTFLVCSDGLSNEVPRDRLKEILGSSATADARVKALIEAANAGGGRDNIAVVVVVVEAVPPPYVDKTPPASKRAVRAAPVPAPAPAPRITPTPPAEPRIEPAPPRAPHDSEPELFLLSIESDPDIDTSDRFLPLASANAGLLDALDTLMRPSAGKAPVPCLGCGIDVDPSHDFCPQCGAPVIGAG